MRTLRAYNTNTPEQIVTSCGVCARKAHDAGEDRHVIAGYDLTFIAPEDRICEDCGTLCRVEED